MTTLFEDEVAMRARDRAYRDRLIEDGTIFPLDARPCLALRPGERERFEREAVEHLSRFYAWLKHDGGAS